MLVNSTAEPNERHTDHMSLEISCEPVPQLQKHVIAPLRIVVAAAAAAMLRALCLVGTCQPAEVAPNDCIVFDGALLSTTESNIVSMFALFVLELELVFLCVASPHRFE